MLVDELLLHLEGSAQERVFLVVGELDDLDIVDLFLLDAVDHVQGNPLADLHDDFAGLLVGHVAGDPLAVQELVVLLAFQADDLVL